MVFLTCSVKDRKSPKRNTWLWYSKAKWGRTELSQVSPPHWCTSETCPEPCIPPKYIFLDFCGHRTVRQSGVAANSWCSCLKLLSAGVIGMMSPFIVQKELLWTLVTTFPYPAVCGRNSSNSRGEGRGWLLGWNALLWSKDSYYRTYLTGSK